MKIAIPLDILPQPDESTCGPTSLHTIYAYYGDDIGLDTVIQETEQLEEGGTLGSLLAIHALQRGYEVIIYTYNLDVFDPSWFAHEPLFIRSKLQQQLQFKQGRKFRMANNAYARFLDLGGKLNLEDLRPALLRKYLKQGIPLLAGLSATYLYRSMREYGPRMEYDDLRGEPSGHFVVLAGYDKDSRTVSVADPLLDNPMSEGHLYETNIDRLINAILLGIITYDANLIVIRPPKKEQTLKHS